MINLQKLHLLGAIKQDIKTPKFWLQVTLLLSFLITMVASVYTLQFLKEDRQLKADYADCMVSLEEEVNR
ncbi:MAG: hypothetical protein Unbinned6284contig1004_39 [Prokaryotic dsDNA virus sp.]|nr:MAG: hypothetical protein Unbinned6284contig1004_39 [Prokaryotic dsDNA virus sp.]|tara:strand:- start:5024 stop:5233 length:210 start_codon:yes stop_codon:yes gene_type:complete